MAAEKFVNFENEGEGIAGTLHLPPKTPAPAVILCHGFGGNRIGGHRLFVHAARELARKGFAALRFDFRGSGESEGLFQFMTISQEMSDLTKAVDWLCERDREEVLKDKIGVVGLSLGAAIAILTAAGDNRLKTVCTWSSPGDFLELQSAMESIFGKVNFDAIVKEPMKDGYVSLPSGERLGLNFIHDALKHKMLESVAKISPRPLLIVHGTADPLIPVSHARKLYESANEPKELFLVEGADHSFNNWDRQWEVINRTVGWFKERL